MNERDRTEMIGFIHGISGHPYNPRFYDPDYKDGYKGGMYCRYNTQQEILKKKALMCEGV